MKLLILLFFICNFAFSQNKTPIVLATSPVVKDIDGNSYNTVKIGTKTWMSENLRVVHFNDNTSIPKTLTASYTLNNTPGYGTWGDVNYNGAYYNWYAVNTGKLCPTGWSVPTLADWQTLSTYLGGAANAGNKMKSTSGWNSPNSNPTNDSGFSGIPTGYCYIYGIGDNGDWWSATQATEESGAAYYGRLYAVGSELQIPFLMKSYGISVRCVQN
jgi:uncharacterized protein (TIGR02145 family)